MREGERERDIPINITQRTTSRREVGISFEAQRGHDTIYTKPCHDKLSRTHSTPHLPARYLTSSGEAITRPRVKGFQLSRRARDPTLARAESAAKAVIAIAEGRARAPCSTVSAGSNSRSPCATTRQNGDDSTEASQEGDQQTALSEVRGSGDGAVSEEGEDGQAVATAVVSDGEAEVVTESRGGTPAGNTTTAPREPAAAAQTEEDDSAHKKPPVQPARQQPEDKAVTSASEQRERATTASPLLSSGEPQTRVAGAATTMPQQDLPQHQPVPSPTAAAAAAGSDSIVTGDEFLSHRSKVRAVVFPRPHTHQARKRPPGPRGLEREGGAPGPGEYDVGGGACDGWGGAGRKGPLVAPKRYVVVHRRTRCGRIPDNTIHELTGSATFGRTEF